MNEPVVSIELIKRQAFEAAVGVDKGETPECPYEHGTDAAHHWTAEFHTARMELSGEASA